MSDEIKMENGQAFGPWRHGINAAQGMKGSIHEDSTAQKIGMRGGTVAGTVHFDLFAPVVQKVFGKSWFEQGCLSMFFTYATINNEEVRAVIDIPPAGARDVQVKGHVEMKDGRIAMEGTVSLGKPGVKSHLDTIEMKEANHADLRILKNLKVGDISEKNVLVTQDSMANRLKNAEDKIDWYQGKSPWDVPIVPLSNLFGTIHIYDNQQFQGVPFFGASEFRMLAGPVKVGVEYRAVNKIVSIGLTSRTELFWIDGWLYEKDKLVATMRHLNRYMKAGSPLYPEVK
jgi:hypothetical protein